MIIVLTPTEQKVVHLLAREGLSCPKAAAKLGCAVSTVRFHLRRIADKIPGEGRAHWKVITHYGIKAA